MKLSFLSSFALLVYSQEPSVSYNTLDQNGNNNRGGGDLSVRGRNVQQLLQGNIRGFGNFGRLVSTGTTTNFGTAESLGRMDIQGSNNHGIIQTNTNIGKDGFGKSSLNGSIAGGSNNKLEQIGNMKIGSTGTGVLNFEGNASGPGNKLVQTGNTTSGRNGISVHNFLSNLGPGTVGTVNSSQIGGKNSINTANVYSNLKGNALKVNNIDQRGKYNTFTNVASLQGVGGTLINNVNGQKGTVNQSLDTTNAKGSTVFNMVKGGATGITTDKNGNSIINLGNKTSGNFVPTQLRSGTPQNGNPQSNRPATQNRNSQSSRPATQNRNSQSSRPATQNSNSQSSRPATQNGSSQSSKPASQSAKSGTPSSNKSSKPSSRSTGSPSRRT
jgi:hypothetical protein